MEDEKRNGAAELPEEQAEEAATLPVAACMEEEKKRWKERLEVLERQVEQLQAQVEMEDAKSAQKLAAKKPAHGQPGTIEDIQYKVMCWLFGRITADMTQIADKIAKKKADVIQKMILMQKEIDAYYGKNPEKLNSVELIKREKAIDHYQQMQRAVPTMLVGTLAGVLIGVLMGTSVPFGWFVPVVVLLIAVLLGYIRSGGKFSTHYEELRGGAYEKEWIHKILKERQEAKRRELEAQTQGPTLIPKDND